MTGRTQAVLWDLDSTLADTSHRHHMIPDILAGESTWDDYAMECGEDTPIEGAVELMRLLVPSYRQVAVSARTSKALNVTRLWVNIHGIPLDDLILRPEGDETPNEQFKVSTIQLLQGRGLTVRLFVEDLSDSAEYIRAEAHVPVLVLNPGYHSAKTGGGI